MCFAYVYVCGLCVCVCPSVCVCVGVRVCVYVWVGRSVPVCVGHVRVWCLREHYCISMSMSKFKFNPILLSYCLEAPPAVCANFPDARPIQTDLSRRSTCPTQPNPTVTGSHAKYFTCQATAIEIP